MYNNALRISWNGIRLRDELLDDFDKVKINISKGKVQTLQKVLGGYIIPNFLYTYSKHLYNHLNFLRQEVAVFH